MTETYRTAPHRRVEWLLDFHGISYLSECELFPPYQLDLYLPEWHLDVEVDGLGHTPKHDGARDEALLRLGVVTLRLDVRKGVKPAVIWPEIKEFIETHAKTTDARKAQWRENRDLPPPGG